MDNLLASQSGSTSIASVPFRCLNRASLPSAVKSGAASSHHSGRNVFRRAPSFHMAIRIGATNPSSKKTVERQRS